MAPEDVFAYCTATPAHIMGQASADEALTVGAARTGQPSYAQLDSPGAGRAHTGGGTVDASAARYRGIRNYVSEHDVIPMLPPTAWGLVRYGVVVDPGEGKVGLDDMAQDLKAVSETYYARFMAGADPRRLSWSILDATRLDLDNLKLDASVMLPTPHLRRQGLQGPARKTRPVACQRLRPPASPT